LNFRELVDVTGIDSVTPVCKAIQETSCGWFF